MTTATIDVTPHIEWASRIARRIAKGYRFVPGGQEEQELIGCAHLVLVRKSHTYEPAREVYATECGALFRGYVSQTVTTECRREARRIRNGGTYHTREEIDGVTLSVEAMGRMVLEDGTAWEPADYRTAETGFAFAD